MEKILAIDDQPDNLITIKAVVKMLLPDYEVVTAMSGTQGIEQAREHQPDVILLDIIMPGMDGYEVCKLLKEDELTKHIPVVMVTALRTDSNSKVRALDLGADAFVSKPFEPVELAAQLKVILRTKKAEDKLRGEKEHLDRLVKERTIVLEEANLFNKSLLDTIPFPIEIVNKRGEILFMNPVLEKLVGKNKIGSFCWELYKDDKQQCKDCPLSEKKLNGKIIKTETEGLFGGRTFEITHRSMIFNGEEAVMEIFVETTERKIFENELITAKEKAQESDRLKTAFLANMSHEIRTPMNGILGFTTLLQEPGLTGEDQNRFIEIIKKSGDRMLNTVDDIIEISKLETGQIKVVNRKLNASLHLNTLFQFFEFEANQKGLQLKLGNQIPDDDNQIITDKNKFSSILSNLIKNAIKFTDKGFIEIGGIKKQQYFEFYVKDTGIGIPKKRIDAIFNRFEQADIDDVRAFEGSGLGLAIAKSYVELLGGKIWVESAINEGSTFYFTIPSVAENFSVAKFNSEGIQNESEKKVKNINVLITEDDEISKLHLSILLKKTATKISFASTGKEAVEFCNQNPDTNLILMDIKMPVMDGFAATRKIRTFNKKVTIIAQTAFALEGDREKALEAGCNDYVSKPISKDILHSTINKYF
ncbi:response regulator [uncultured Draconibacterium sp.]|uniref:hybrid sensor histidine kinase/response regulator n=1 Tax=uncultured Draconibacterium sp. TaxID=1573823 RepID=UPI0032179344